MELQRQNVNSVIAIFCRHHLVGINRGHPVTYQSYRDLYTSRPGASGGHGSGQHRRRTQCSGSKGRFNSGTGVPPVSPLNRPARCLSYSSTSGTLVRLFPPSFTLSLSKVRRAQADSVLNGCCLLSRTSDSGLLTANYYLFPTPDYVPEAGGGVNNFAKAARNVDWVNGLLTILRTCGGIWPAAFIKSPNPVIRITGRPG